MTRTGKGLMVALSLLLMVGFSSCEKKTHKVLASKDGSRGWLIDEMVFEQRDDGTLEHDTLLYNVGTFVFVQDKRRDEHGTGSLSRREFQNGEWTNGVVAQFVWEMEGESVVRINYLNGVEEVVQIEESQKKTQRWISTSFETGKDVERNYFLTRNQ